MKVANDVSWLLLPASAEINPRSAPAAVLHRSLLESKRLSPRGCEKHPVSEPSETSFPFSLSVQSVRTVTTLGDIMRGKSSSIGGTAVIEPSNVHDQPLDAWSPQLIIPHDSPAAVSSSGAKASGRSQHTWCNSQRFSRHDR
jgi:hypothetical protein